MPPLDESAVTSTCGMSEAELAELSDSAKRDLICDEVASALSKYSKLITALEEKHGPCAYELAEPSLYYGRCLLESGRANNTLLEDAPDVVKEECSGDVGAISGGDIGASSAVVTSSGEAEEADECSSSKRPKLEDEPKPVVEDSKPATQEVKSDVVEAAPCEVEPDSSVTPAESENMAAEEGEIEPFVPEADADMPAGDAEEEEEENEADDTAEEETEPAINDLQLAWENLDLARRLFASSEKDADRLKVATCLYYLAEVSLENQKFDDAVTDLKAALVLQHELLPAHDREIASTLFCLGIAYQLSGQLPDAKTSFASARQVLESWLLAEVAGGSEKEGVSEMVVELREREEGVADEMKTSKLDEAAIAELRRRLLEDKKVGSTPAEEDASVPVSTLQPRRKVPVAENVAQGSEVEKT